MNLFDLRSPDDIKALKEEELKELAEEIRRFLIMSIAKTGGHLSSNLGVVELTIALHKVFDSPRDKIFFDVGHQSYVHKILTGRIKEFKTLRQYKGLSGFQKRRESVHDVWEAGHYSTSISAALGMAIARDLQKEHYQVIPVIGDAAFASGMSFEALNQIGEQQRNMIIILNDNDMSISKNVGAIQQTLTKMRVSKSYTALKSDLKGALSGNQAGNALLKAMRSVKNAVKENVIPDNIFTELHIDYIGPVDGHDIGELIKVFESAKQHQGPLVIHVITKKGKGYPYAENDKEGKWHGVSPFDIESGRSLSMLPHGHKSWSEIITDAVCDLAEQNKQIVAITPAMISGSKLERFFSAYPQRSFDCGIAEEHAMTFAAALALNGFRPFISVYSSFLQRAYDQINHDVARMDLPVVIGVDRAGLVGEDGETHHGVFDIAMLRSIPNLIIAQPKDAKEARSLLKLAFSGNHPFVIRYPRGSEAQSTECEAITCGTWVKYPCIAEAKAIVIAYGSDVDKIIAKAKVNEIALLVVNARFFKPLDHNCLDELAQMHLPIFVYETDLLAGGLSSAILEYGNDSGKDWEIHRIGIGDHFVEHGSLPNLRKQEHIDLNTLFEELLHVIR